MSNVPTNSVHHAVLYLSYTLPPGAATLGLYYGHLFQTHCFQLHRIATTFTTSVDVTCNLPSQKIWNVTPRWDNQLCVQQLWITSLDECTKHVSHIAFHHEDAPWCNTKPVPMGEWILVEYLPPNIWALFFFDALFRTSPVWYYMISYMLSYTFSTQFIHH